MPLTLPKINTNWLLLGLAIVLGGGAAYLGNRALERRMHELDEQARQGHETIPVVVAKRDLARGDAIGPEHFAVRAVPKEFLHGDAVRPAQFSEMERQRLAVSLKRGDVLLPVHSEGNGSQVFSATLNKGRRALTFEVDAVNSISGMLRPGDRVDLIYSARAQESSSTEVTRPLLSNVEVLATDQVLSRRDEETGRERSFTTITLELTPLDAQRVIVAKQSGRLTALLRHPEDKDDNRTAALSADALLHGIANGRGAAGQAVEFIVGGSGNGPADVQLQLSRMGAASPATAGRTNP